MQAMTVGLQDLRVLRAYKVRQDHKVQLDHRVQLARKVLQELTEPTVRMV